MVEEVYKDGIKRGQGNFVDFMFLDNIANTIFMDNLISLWIVFVRLFRVHLFNSLMGSRSVQFNVSLQ